MVGDRYRHDIEGAREAGLVPVDYGSDAHGAAEYESHALREPLDVVDVSIESQARDGVDPGRKDVRAVSTERCRRRARRVLADRAGEWSVGRGASGERHGTGQHRAGMG
jgi:hypothetical protein